MARESTMTQIPPSCAQWPGDSWSPLTVLSGQRLLSGLGSNLRSVYEDITDSAQPSDLMRLAALIDERRGTSDT